jgi:hypothetical protein
VTRDVSSSGRGQIAHDQCAAGETLVDELGRAHDGLDEARYAVLAGIVAQPREPGGRVGKLDSALEGTLVR